jgi:hypothetical protein
VDKDDRCLAVDRSPLSISSSQLWLLMQFELFGCDARAKTHAEELVEGVP